jgi:hypothetical protein
VDARFGLFGDSAWLRRKVGAWFAPNVPSAQKSFWMHPMDLLGDIGHVESRFNPFGDSGQCKIGALFAPNVPRHKNCF